ncbi:MAG: hypothetical protein AAFX99_21270, partial [Myxococcota bacterium]
GAEAIKSGAATLGAIPTLIVAGGLLTLGAAFMEISTPVNPDQQVAKANELTSIGVRGFMAGILGSGGQGGPFFTQAMGRGRQGRAALKGTDAYASWLEEAQKKDPENAQQIADARLDEEIRKQEAQIRAAARSKLSPAARRIIWNSWLAQHGGRRDSLKQAVAAALFGHYNDWPQEVKVQTGHAQNESEEEKFDDNLDKARQHAERQREEEEEESQREMGRKLQRDLMVPHGDYVSPNNTTYVRQRKLIQDARSKAEKLSLRCKGYQSRGKTLPAAGERLYGQGWTYIAKGNQKSQQFEDALKDPEMATSSSVASWADAAVRCFDKAAHFFEEGNKVTPPLM